MEVSMKKIIFTVCFIFLSSFHVFGSSVEMVTNPLNVYPKAPEGMKQHIFTLEKKEKEEDYQLELRFGKDKMLDCNQHSFLSGELKEMTAEGWQYPYYSFSGKDEMRQTLMLCPETEKSLKRVYYPVMNSMFPYNSKLPLVVYAPKDVKIEVHIWKRIEKISSRD